MTGVSAAAEERLVLAVEAAGLGTWTWDIGTGVIAWNERLEEMHGLPPGGYGGTFEDWVAGLHSDDRAGFVAEVEAAVHDRRPYMLIYRTTWADGSVHSLECRGAVLVDDAGHPVGTTGVAIDITERERLVQTLQRALLPTALPVVPGVKLAARYRPAEGRIELGGDWYSAVALSDGRLGVAIGDVAGHGLAAVTHMASARFSLRALALSGDTPDVVLSLLDSVCRTFEAQALITALYGVLDPNRQTWSYATAGHLPPLVCSIDGSAIVLDPIIGPPLGFSARRTNEVTLNPGDTVLLYTDGLIERRSETLAEGIERLRVVSQHGPHDPDELCDYLVHKMLPDGGTEDDAALICTQLL